MTRFRAFVGGTTGEQSIFTHWNGYQVMFHCAPFIPFDPNDHQQVERRRFIGNDIVRYSQSCLNGSLASQATLCASSHLHFTLFPDRWSSFSKRTMTRSSLISVVLDPARIVSFSIN